MLVVADAEATERLTHTRALSSCSPVPGKPRPSPLWLLSSADAVPAPVGALGAAAALALAEPGAASTKSEGAAAVRDDSLPLWCR